MLDLAAFQRAFAAQLLRPLPRVSPLSIYRNTVLLGALDALRDNFPVTRALVGEEAFATLASAYSERFPPASPVLAAYGGSFPLWLSDHPIALELPYLGEVADCERLWVEALHSADGPALDLADLSGMAAEGLLHLPIALHPAARVAWHANPAMAIWLAHQGDAIGEIAPDWRPTGALFVRPQLNVAGIAIGIAEYRLLSGIADGETLGEAALAVVSHDPAADIGSCFAGLVQRGAFAALPHERHLS